MVTTVLEQGLSNNEAEEHETQEFTLGALSVKYNLRQFTQAGETYHVICNLEHNGKKLFSGVNFVTNPKLPPMYIENDGPKKIMDTDKPEIWLPWPQLDSVAKNCVAFHELGHHNTLSNTNEEEPNPHMVADIPQEIVKDGNPQRIMDIILFQETSIEEKIACIRQASQYCKQLKEYVLHLERIANGDMVRNVKDLIKDKDPQEQSRIQGVMLSIIAQNQRSFKKMNGLPYRQSNIPYSDVLLKFINDGDDPEINRELENVVSSNESQILESQSDHKIVNKHVLPNEREVRHYAYLLDTNRSHAPEEYFEIDDEDKVILNSALIDSGNTLTIYRADGTQEQFELIDLGPELSKGYNIDVRFIGISDSTGLTKIIEIDNDGTLNLRVQDILIFYNANRVSISKLQISDECRDQAYKTLYDLYEKMYPPLDYIE